MIKLEKSNSNNKYNICRTQILRKWRIQLHVKMHTINI